MVKDTIYVRRRAHKPKVTSGCLTCKSRHVKCDEAKPSCLRCLKFWGFCEGYQKASRQEASHKTRRVGVLAPNGALNSTEGKRGKMAQFLYSSYT